jgi:hypothetical protein
MSSFSTPFENITSLLGSSDAWKRYFGSDRTKPADYSQYKPDKSSSALPWSVKGIDFDTGKTVDLGQFAEAYAASGADKELTPFEYKSSASPYSDADIDSMYKKWSGIADQQRVKELATNLAYMKPLQQSILDTAYKTRQFDLQNKLYYQSKSPVVAAELSAMGQQQGALASGAFATELDAMTRAIAAARDANIRGMAARPRVA